MRDTTKRKPNTPYNPSQKRQSNHQDPKRSSHAVLLLKLQRSNLYEFVWT